MTTLLVQMADAAWTMDAMHVASTLARTAGTNVTLLHLIPVTHPSYLGTTFGTTAPSERDYQLLHQIAETAEDYGVELTIQPMQYVSLVEAVAEAAETLDADVVFARIPASRIAFWRRFQIWNLDRLLRRERRQLVTLDLPIESIRWIPSITVKAALPHA
jgi:hypothetical protein